MLLRIILMLALGLVSLTNLAEPQRYWILGTFVHEDSATAEKARLSRLLDMPMQLLFDEERALYRIAIDAEKISRVELGAIDAWALTLDTHEQASEHAPTPTEPEVSEAALELDLEPAIETEVVEIPPAAKTVVENTDFKERESLTEYCERLPETSLCLHSKTRSILQRNRVLSGSELYNRESCDQLVDHQRRKRCLQNLD